MSSAIGFRLLGYQVLARSVRYLVRMKSGFTPGRQQAGLRLEELPAQSHLVQLLNAAQKGLDKNHWLYWPGLQPDVHFSLSVICYGQQNRRSWQLEQKLVITEPEWRMFRETESGRAELWTVKSSDSELIHGLIAQETSGGVKEPDGMENYFAARVGPPEDLKMSGGFQMPPGFGQPQPMQVASPATLPDASNGALNLSGTLKDMDLPSVMQSINLCKMTGKLNVYDRQQQAEVYFTDGELVHAELGNDLQTSSKLTGDIVLLDLFTWEEASFKFQHGWKTAEQSVKKRMHSLLLEGAALRDYQDALTSKGLTMASSLCRGQNTFAITEAEFDARMKKDGIPVHTDLQKQVFIALRTPTTLENLLYTIPMPKSTWVPVMFNLINLDFVTIAGGKDEVEEKDGALLFAGIDDLIIGAQKALIQPDSGMHSYGNFLLSARNELVRNQHGGPSFCVAMLEMPDATALSATAMNGIANVFDKIRRPFDVLAFSMPNFLFLLMPQCDSAYASRATERFVALVSDTQLDSVVHGRNLAIKGGIACVPADGTELVQILTAASRNRRRANAQNTIVTSLT